MGILTGLHGLTAISVICLLLFVEETGVPIPLLSGDVLLVLAGVLIVNGSISAWEFFRLRSSPRWRVSRSRTFGRELLASGGSKL